MSTETLADLTRVIPWVQNGKNPALTLDPSRAQLLLDAVGRALAVGTLDAHDPDWTMSARTSAETGVEFSTCYVPSLDRLFEGETPDAARAAAAKAIEAGDE